MDVSVIPDSVNRRVDDIVQTQEVTENGDNLDENQTDDLERRLNALIADEPQAINPDEERMNDLNRRLEALRTMRPGLQQVSDNVDNSEERYNRLAEEMSTDTDLRNELEELMNQDGGGNTQSKMTLFDDLDSDDFEDNIDSDEKINVVSNSDRDVFKLKVDELSYLLKSIKLNNGCDDVINFCKTSRQLKNDCSNIPEIRDNIYTPCLIELMIMKVNNIDIDYDKLKSSMNLNRKDLLELEKEI